jgi:hypothetical protein
MFLTDGNHIGDVMGCISFVCSGCAEHVLAKEVVRNTLREQTEQCAGCTTFWGSAEGIKMAEPIIFFFYIEFIYTLLIFLKLRNTKEMRGFFRGRRDCVNCEYSPLLFYKSIILVQIWFLGEHRTVRSVLTWSSLNFPSLLIQLIFKKKLFGLQHHYPWWIYGFQIIFKNIQNMPDRCKLTQTFF